MEVYSMKKTIKKHLIETLSMYGEYLNYINH